MVGLLTNPKVLPKIVDIMGTNIYNWFVHHVAMGSGVIQSSRSIFCVENHC